MLRSPHHRGGSRSRVLVMPETSQLAGDTGGAGEGDGGGAYGAAQITVTDEVDALS